MTNKAILAAAIIMAFASDAYATGCWSDWTIGAGDYDTGIFKWNKTYSMASTFTGSDSTGFKLCLPDSLTASGSVYNQTIIYGYSEDVGLSSGFNYTFGFYSNNFTSASRYDMFGLMYADQNARVLPNNPGAENELVMVYYAHQTPQILQSTHNTTILTNTTDTFATHAINGTYSFAMDTAVNKLYLYADGVKTIQWNYDPSLEGVTLIPFFAISYSDSADTRPDKCIFIKNLQSDNGAAPAVSVAYSVKDNVTDAPLDLCTVSYAGGNYAYMPTVAPSESVVTAGEGKTAFQNLTPSCQVGSNGYEADYNVNVICPGYASAQTFQISHPSGESGNYEYLSLRNYTAAPYGISNCSMEVRVKLQYNSSAGGLLPTDNANVRIKNVISGVETDLFDQQDGTGRYFASGLACQPVDVYASYDVDPIKIADRKWTETPLDLGDLCKLTGTGIYYLNMGVTATLFNTNITVRLLNNSAWDMSNVLVDVYNSPVPSIVDGYNKYKSDCENTAGGIVLENSAGWVGLNADGSKLTKTGTFNTDTVVVKEGILCARIKSGGIVNTPDAFVGKSMRSYYGMPSYVEINMSMPYSKQQYCICAFDEQLNVNIPDVLLTVSGGGLGGALLTQTNGVISACFNDTYMGEYNTYVVSAEKTNYQPRNNIELDIAPGDESCIGMKSSNAGGDASKKYIINGFVRSNASSNIVANMPLIVNCIEGTPPRGNTSTATGTYALWPFYHGSECSIGINNKEYTLLGCVDNGDGISGRCEYTVTGNRSVNVTVGKKNAGDKSMDVIFRVLGDIPPGDKGIQGARITVVYGGTVIGSVSTIAQGYAERAFKLEEGRQYQVLTTARGYLMGDTLLTISKSDEVLTLYSVKGVDSTGSVYYYNVSADNTTQSDAVSRGGAIVRIYEAESGVYVAERITNLKGLYQFDAKSDTIYRIEVEYEGIKAEPILYKTIAEGYDEIPRITLALKTVNVPKQNAKVQDFFQRWAYPLSYLLIVLLFLIILGMFVKTLRKAWKHDDD